MWILLALALAAPCDAESRAIGIASDADPKVALQALLNCSQVAYIQWVARRGASLRSLQSLSEEHQVAALGLLHDAFVIDPEAFRAGATRLNWRTLSELAAARADHPKVLRVLSWLDQEGLFSTRPMSGARQPAPAVREWLRASLTLAADDPIPTPFRVAWASEVFGSEADEPLVELSRRLHARGAEVWYFPLILALERERTPQNVRTQVDRAVRGASADYRAALIDQLQKTQPAETLRILELPRRCRKKVWALADTPNLKQAWSSVHACDASTATEVAPIVARLADRLDPGARADTLLHLMEKGAPIDRDGLPCDGPSLADRAWTLVEADKRRQKLCRGEAWDQRTVEAIRASGSGQAADALAARLVAERSDLALRALAQSADQGDDLSALAPHRDAIGPRAIAQKDSLPTTPEGQQRLALFFRNSDHATALTNRIFPSTITVPVLQMEVCPLPATEDDLELGGIGGSVGAPTSTQRLPKPRDGARVMLRLFTAEVTRGPTSEQSRELRRFETKCGGSQHARFALTPLLEGQGLEDHPEVVAWLKVLASSDVERLDTP